MLEILFHEYEVLHRPLFRYINASLAGQIDEAVGAFRWMAPQRLRFSKPDNYSDVCWFTLFNK